MIDRASTFHSGQLVHIVDPDLNAAHADVTVVSIGSGDRVVISYGDVPRLTVSASKLAPLNAHGSQLSKRGAA